jgi:hypothetical protein
VQVRHALADVVIDGDERAVGPQRRLDGARHGLHFAE